MATYVESSIYAAGDEPPNNICLGDILSDELVRTTEFVLLYISEDGQYKTVCMGVQASKFNTDHSVIQKWKTLTSTQEPVDFNPKYRCLQCSYSTNYLHNMNSHHSSKHPEFANLKTEQKWNAHYAKFTRKQKNGKSDGVMKGSEGDTPQVTTMDRYKCPHCNYKSMYYKNMHDHIATEHKLTSTAKALRDQSDGVGGPVHLPKDSPHSCSDDEHSYKGDDMDEEDKSSLGSTPEDGGQEPFKPLSKPGTSKATVNCEFCNQKFDHKKLKDIHVNACHRVGDCFRCPYCKQRVLCQEWTEHLNQHNTTTPVSAYCPECNKTFKSMRNLRNHRLEVHKEGESYACPEENCSSVFARARNLRMHMELHKGSKHHVCDVCGEGYALKSSLTKHYKAKHSATNHPTNTYDAKQHNSSAPQAYGTQNLKPIEPMNKHAINTAQVIAAAPVNQPMMQQIYQPPALAPLETYRTPEGYAQPVAPGHLVKEEVVMGRTDPGICMPPNTGAPVDMSQQAPMVLPQPTSDIIQRDGLAMEPGVRADVPHAAPVSAPRSHKKIIKRQSSMDLGNTHIDRQTSMEIGVDEEPKGDSTTSPMENGDIFRCHYCKHLYFNTKAQLKSHVLGVHKATSSQEAADREATRNHKPEAKIVSQFSNTPHTQLSEDLIEAAYLLSIQQEQQSQMQPGQPMPDSQELQPGQQLQPGQPLQQGQQLQPGQQLQQGQPLPQGQQLPDGTYVPAPHPDSTIQ